jgi:hypothetical protein
MVGFLLGLFRLVWLFGKGHRAVVLENRALRQQIYIYRRKKKRPRLSGYDRWFWIALSAVWKDWRKTLIMVHPDTVVRWQRERFRRYWANLSQRPGRLGRPPLPCRDSGVDSNFGPSHPLMARATYSRRTSKARDHDDPASLDDKRQALALIGKQLLPSGEPAR